MDQDESVMLRRTSSNNSGLRMVGSGTNLSLMGDGGLDETSLTHRKLFRRGSLNTYPDNRDTGSMTEISDMMYRQQRRCEHCSNVIGTSVRPNW